MDFSFLGEGWDFFKQTWRAALGLAGLYLLVVGVPALLAVGPMLGALQRGGVPPSGPGPLFWLTVAVNFLLMPAVYWATMLMASAPGAGEEPRVILSLQEGFRNWWKAVRLGVLLLIVSLIPMFLLAPLSDLLGPLGGLLSAVYSGVLLVYAQFALLGLVRVPWMNVLDALKEAVGLVPKARWPRTVGVVVLLGLAAQFLTGALAAALFRLAGLPLRVEGAAAFTPAVFFWVTVANVPVIVFSWYQLLCVVSLWWRFRGLRVVTGVGAGEN